MFLMVVMVMGSGRERRTGKRHQKQRYCKQFLHKTNPNMRVIAGES